MMKVGTDKKPKSNMHIREFIEYIICLLISCIEENYALQSSGLSWTFWFSSVPTFIINVPMVKSARSIHFNS